MKALDEILVNENGECTVFGPLAHQFWDMGRGGFPRRMSGSQGFFIFQAQELCGRTIFDCRAVQSTREGALRFTTPYCVLVECRAPDTRASVGELAMKAATRGKTFAPVAW